jgi:hypothetical protein
LTPKTAGDPFPTWLARRRLLVLAGLGALLLVVAEFSTLYEVVAMSAVVPGGSSTAGAHHGYALLIVALASLPMAYGAVVGGSRPAAFALVALGAIALFVTLAVDLPAVGDEGLLAQSYERAKASPRSGFSSNCSARSSCSGRGWPAPCGARAPPRRRRAAPRRRGRYPTLRTSLPRTWPASRRSCASAARSSGKDLLDVRLQAPGLQVLGRLAQVLAARAHEDVVRLEALAGRG